MFNGLTFDECFGIASCHFTGSKKSIEAIAELQPAFFTLKSTSVLKGGNGRGRRHYKSLSEYDMPGTYFVDGDKTLELLDLKSTLDLLEFAKSLCPSAKVGVSLTAGEDYTTIIPEVDKSGCDYIELCYKYTPRSFATLYDNTPDHFMVETHRFVQRDVALASRVTSTPLFVKLPRDMPWITSQSYMQSLDSQLGRPIGYVLADTQKCHVYLGETYNGKYLPKVKHYEGVIAGSSLLPETLSIIHRNTTHGLSGIMATGGIMDAFDAFHALLHGASAITLCSALQYHGLRYYHTFRDELNGYLRTADIDAVVDLTGSFVKKSGPSMPSAA